MAHLKVNEIAMTNKGVGTMKKRLALEPILSLILIITLALTACTSETSGTTNTNDTTLETDSETTEPSKDSVNANPLLTEEMWGEVPDAKEAQKIFDSYEKIEFSECNNSNDYRRIRTSSQNWTLENKEGNTLFCKDGILYGDMPYYSPISPDGSVKTDDCCIYDGGWLFIDDSEEIIYLPADTCDSDFAISVDVSTQGDYMTWEYDKGKQSFIGQMEKWEYINEIERLGYDYEYMVYLSDGTAVEKVVVSENEINIFGDRADYPSITAITATPPQIVFVTYETGQNVSP